MRGLFCHRAFQFSFIFIFRFFILSDTGVFWSLREERTKKESAQLNLALLWDSDAIGTAEALWSAVAIFGSGRGGGTTGNIKIWKSSFTWNNLEFSWFSGDIRYGSLPCAWFTDFNNKTSSSLQLSSTYGADYDHFRINMNRPDSQNNL